MFHVIQILRAFCHMFRDETHPTVVNALKSTLVPEISTAWLTAFCTIESFVGLVASYGVDSMNFFFFQFPSVV